MNLSIESIWAGSAVLQKKPDLHLLAIYQGKEEGKNGSKLYIEIIEVYSRIILPCMFYILLHFLFRKRSEAYMIYSCPG